MTCTGYMSEVFQLHGTSIWGNYPLCGVITQLAARCCNVNMGFQKLEPISFNLMYVDK